MNRNFPAIGLERRRLQPGLGPSGVRFSIR